MLQQRPFRVLGQLVLHTCVMTTCARLQSEAVDLLLVHSCRPTHARRQVEAEVRNQPRNAGVVQDARQRLPNALPGACAARETLTRQASYADEVCCDIKMGTLGCGGAHHLVDQLLARVRVKSHYSMMCCTLGKGGLASTKREEPLGCALCIKCTALLKPCTAVSCAVFCRRQFSMRHGPALLR